MPPSPARTPRWPAASTSGKGHGRIETRRYWQSTPIDWFADRGKWEGLRSEGLVESVRAIHGHTSTERRHHLIPIRH